jgi:hypothetical protein
MSDEGNTSDKADMNVIQKNTRVLENERKR